MLGAVDLIPGVYPTLTPMAKRTGRCHPDSPVCMHVAYTNACVIRSRPRFETNRKLFHIGPDATVRLARHENQKFLASSSRSAMSRDNPCVSRCRYKTTRPGPRGPRCG